MRQANAGMNYVEAALALALAAAFVAALLGMGYWLGMGV